MGRKSSFGSLFIKAVNATAKEAERDKIRKERESIKLAKLIQRNEIANQKIAQKVKASEDKERAKKDKELVDNLSPETIKKFNLGNVSYSPIEYEFDSNLTNVISLIKNSEYQEFIKKIKLSDVDQFLYNGKYNSVLGPDGFIYFKNELKTIIDGVNKQTNKDNFINLDDFFEVLLRSGLYYEYDHTPSELKSLDTIDGWLTAYRFISKNFKTITYKEFRSIVKDIQKSDGNTIEFAEKDKSSELYKKVSDSGLFNTGVNISSILSKYEMTKLRDLCEKFDVVPKRSKLEIVSELIKNDELVSYLESLTSGNDLYFTINDIDLVTGVNIIHLDKYLREMSKLIRNELFDFVSDKQLNKLVG